MTSLSLTKAKVLLTGGSGDLGKLLIPELQKLGASVSNIDVNPCKIDGVTEHLGSIEDRALVRHALMGVDIVIHIAAWHGYHEFTKAKSDEEFWDTNMTGTFNLLHACAEQNCQKFLFISSTSVDEWPGVYGMTKQLGEDLVSAYAKRFSMQTLSLRPRAFIPWWNTSVYATYLEWANWFSKGAVHIEDVNQATILGAKFLLEKEGEFFDWVEVDGKHDFSNVDMESWQTLGADIFLEEKFGKSFLAAKKAAFNPENPPRYKDLKKAKELLSYSPRFGYQEMLEHFSRT